MKKLMTFEQIKNGQYDVTIDLKGTGIIITKDILKKINQFEERVLEVVRHDVKYNQLRYKSETLLPEPDCINKKKKKILFILGNPAIHSITNKMFFYSKKNGDRHSFWGKLVKNSLLEDFQSTREEEACRRRKLIIRGNTNHHFVIGFTTFYSLPTPTGIRGNPYCDSNGVVRFLKPILRQIQEEEYARIMIGIKKQPEVSSFAKDAILITTITAAYEYLIDKRDDHRIEYWPIRGEGSGWKKLQDILNNI